MVKKNKLTFGILFLFVVLSVSFISAVSSFGYDYLEHGETVIEGRNYTINVNNSNFWNGHAWSDVRWLDIDGGNANQNIDIGVYNFTTSGRVGIGTNLPLEQFNVVGNSIFEGNISIWDTSLDIGSGTVGIPDEWEHGAFIKIGDGINNNDAGIFMGGVFEGFQLWYEEDGNDAYIDNIGDCDTCNIKFRTRTAGTPINAMTILGSGNVGIGTASPTEKLTVVGNISLTSTGTKITTTGKELILEQTGDTLGTTRLRLQNRVGSAGALFESDDLDLVDFGFKPSVGPQMNFRLEHRASEVEGGNTGGEFQLIEAGTGDVWFRSGESATIIATGNVGIGTSAPQNTLNVNGTGNFTSNFTVDDNTLFVNAENNRVGIGTTDPQQELNVIGDVNVTGDLYIGGNISLEFGDLVSELNPYAGNAIRLKGTGDDVDIVLGDVSGYFSIWDVTDTAPVFSINNQGDIVTTGGAIFNENSADRNFRFESNDNEYMLFVDGEENKIGIGTANPQQELNVIGDGNFTGNLYGSLIHGEMWAHSDTGNWLGDINTQHIYINLSINSTETTESGQTLNGFVYEPTTSSLISQISGLYKVDYSISTGNAGNNQEYQYIIAKNNVIQNQTDAHRKIGAAGDVGNSGSSGFIELAVGDFINLQARNNDGTADLIIHAVNVNLFRMGNL